MWGEGFEGEGEGEGCEGEGFLGLEQLRRGHKLSGGGWTGECHESP